MFQGKNLTYIRHEKNEGVSQKSGKSYCFANVTVSDGMESFKLEMSPDLDSQMNALRKGDKINLELDVTEQFNKHTFIVSRFALSTTQKAV